MNLCDLVQDLQNDFCSITTVIVKGVREKTVNLGIGL